MFRSVGGLGAAFVVLVAVTALGDVLLAGWMWHLTAVVRNYTEGALSEVELNGTLPATSGF